MNPHTIVQDFCEKLFGDDVDFVTACLPVTAAILREPPGLSDRTKKVCTSRVVDTTWRKPLKYRIFCSVGWLSTELSVLLSSKMPHFTVLSGLQNSSLWLAYNTLKVVCCSNLNPAERTENVSS